MARAMLLIRIAAPRPLPVWPIATPIGSAIDDGDQHARDRLDQMLAAREPMPSRSGQFSGRRSRRRRRRRGSQRRHRLSAVVQLRRRDRPACASTASGPGPMRDRITSKTSGEQRGCRRCPTIASVGNDRWKASRKNEPRLLDRRSAPPTLTRLTVLTETTRMPASSTGPASGSSTRRTAASGEPDRRRRLR